LENVGTVGHQEKEMYRETRRIRTLCYI